MNKWIWLLMCLCFSRLVCAQDRNLDNLDSVFNAFSEDMDDQYRNYLQKMDEDFLHYLQQHWDGFSVIQGMDDVEYTVLDVMPQAERTSPRLFYTGYGDSPDSRLFSVQFDFFGEKASFKVDKASQIRLSGISEVDVAKACRQLFKTDVSSVFQQTEELLTACRLNDWGELLIFDKLSKHLFDEERPNERMVFLYYLLLRRGFDVKLGRTDKLLLLVPYAPKVFRQDCIEINNRFYYVYDALLSSSGSRIFTYKENHALATQVVDLNLNLPPLFRSDPAKKQFQNKTSGRMMEITWNRKLVSFYNTYPHTTLPVYFHAGLSAELKTAFVQAFGIADTPDKKEACIRRLLPFFHEQLPYKSDTDHMGYEWKLFPEQTLAFPYSDCEDRAVLFAHLAQALTGLDVILLVYPRHVSAGICFDREIKGSSIQYKSKTYLVCDPSFYGASVGDLMPALKNRKVQILPFIH